MSEGKMLSADRTQAIYTYIQKQHSASVAELSKQFFISETSIRRDLQKLASLGLIRKTYGGAIVIQGNNEVIALEARQQMERAEKVDIAQKAAAMVKNGNVIFLDSSSTTLSMVPFFSRLSDLSVITNGLQIAAALTKYPQFKIYVLGGLLNNRTFSLCGTLTRQLIGNMHANCAFVSPKGVDSAGHIYCANEEEADVRRMMIELSDQAVLLCSHKKLGQHAAFRLCDLGDITTFVCEQTPEAYWTDMLKEKNVTLV